MFPDQFKSAFTILALSLCLAACGAGTGSQSPAAEGAAEDNNAVNAEETEVENPTEPNGNDSEAADDDSDVADDDSDVADEGVADEGVADEEVPDEEVPDEEGAEENPPNENEDSDSGSVSCISPEVGAAPGEVMINSRDTLALGNDEQPWGQLHFSSTALPQGLANARETFQSARYNGRTGWEPNKESVPIPMRAHWAHCISEDAQGNAIDNLFVSMTLQAGETTEDNVGSVFHMQLDRNSQSYVRTGNEIILNGMCHQAHGIAANADCSRVALLCETAAEKQLDPCVSVTKDIVAESGDIHTKKSNNYQGIENFLSDSSLPDALVNFEKYDRNNPSHIESLVPINNMLPVLQSTYPSVFDSDSNYKNLNRTHFATLLAQSSQFLGKMDEFKAIFRERRSLANEEVWLLEWNTDSEPVTLDNHFDSYIVSKLAGGSGAKTAMNLIYTDGESDSQGRGSYAFAHNTRLFDSLGASHVSGGLNIIKRDQGDNKGIWQFDFYDENNPEGRGWSNECTLGHVFNMRTVYNPFNEKYAAVCTTDASWLNATAQGENGLYEDFYKVLGQIAIKDESNESKTSHGRWLHQVPTTKSYEAMGGGHTLVALDEQTSMLAFVAAQHTSKSAFEGFLQAVEEETLPVESAEDKSRCATVATRVIPNCDMGFLDHLMLINSEDQTYSGVKPFFNYFGLTGAPVPESVPEFMRTISRIGLLKTYGQEPIPGQRVQWIGDEWDLNAEGKQTLDGVVVGDGTDGSAVACSYSDPQLVNLGNGRLLLGYAKHFCSDGQYNSNAYNSLRIDRAGGIDMLVPISYYLAELDLDGNIVEGPVELKSDDGTAFGWGGLDEIIAIGDGKAAWLYVEKPTRDNPSVQVPNPLQNQWRVMTYESAYRAQ